MGQSLLERLAPVLQQNGMSRFAERGVSPLADSVRRHLGRLLNSRDGLSATCPDYGLPDLASEFEAVVPQRHHLETVIKERICKYEPRLRKEDVQVTYLGRGRGPFIAHFEIRGRLVARTQDRTGARAGIAMQTRHDEEGLVIIERTDGGSEKDRG